MFDQDFQQTSRVMVTVSFYKRDAEGNPTFNDETGARFWLAPLGDGSFRMPARVDKAQGVHKKGHDISTIIEGAQCNLILDRESVQLLKAETKSMDQGAGAQFIVELTKEINFGILTITKSRRGRNGERKSMTISGTLAGDEIRPAALTLTDNVQLDSLDDIKAHVAGIKQGQIDDLNASRNAQTNSARAGMAEAATGACT